MALETVQDECQWSDASEVINNNFKKTSSQGAYYYADNTTTTTPIELTLADTQYQLTNDTLGDDTLIDYGLSGLTDVWDSSTNTLQWQDESTDVLSVGDTIDIRIDLDFITTKTNSAINMVLELGTGAQLPIVSEQNYKTTGTYNLVRLFSCFLNSEDALMNNTKILVSCDDTGSSVTVNAFYIRLIHTNK